MNNGSGKKIFLIDVDGTLCEDIKNEEGSRRMARAKPFPDSIKAVNRLYKGGNYICIFTSRTDSHRRVTENWLKRHRVRYHAMLLNKPRKLGKYTSYHWIDDVHVQATTFRGSFTDFVKKKVEIEDFH